ncbi:MAG: Glu/Leu/Phe/Val dehydrogenase [Cryomorphaceae bacterium]|nr:MAG: Glu/Leu/Phe/Val dehydrogenase [Cryomorphaceae bacterium]
MLKVEDQQSVGAHENPIIRPMVDMDHEQVLFCQDKATGLRAIIAVHNTVLGPSLGGTRMWTYNNEMEALNDVLRLSRGMTYKSAISGLNLGGGKAVIIGDSRKDKSEALFRRFGQFVDSLGGKYITAEDVGINTRDIEYVSMETEHVAGLPEYRGGGGDPSPVTAYGVYMGMKAAVKFQSGNDNLAGKKVLVQGAGHVGQYLVELLVKEGAKVVISDIHEDRIKATKAKFAVEVIDADKVYDGDMDIYAPCALGATINDDTLGRLRCSIIAGAANNQLAEEARHGAAVMEKGIIYAPDFLINAGGIINCYSEVIGYNRDMAYRQTEDIYQTTLNILQKSADEKIPTYLAANRMAEERIASIASINQRL